MIVEDLRSLRLACKSKRLGYTSGVFDLFHLGHVSYLEHCKMLCDVLVVGVDSDEVVRGNKGEGRPIESEGDRLIKVNGNVDYCFLKEKPSIYYVEIIRPSCHFFSSEKVLRSAKISEISAVEEFENFFLIPYVDGVSTTEILRLRGKGDDGNGADLFLT